MYLVYFPLRRVNKRVQILSLGFSGWSHLLTCVASTSVFTHLHFNPLSDVYFSFITLTFMFLLFSREFLCELNEKNTQQMKQKLSSCWKTVELKRGGANNSWNLLSTIIHYKHGDLCVTLGWPWTHTCTHTHTHESEHIWYTHKLTFADERV